MQNKAIVKYLPLKRKAELNKLFTKIKYHFYSKKINRRQKQMHYCIKLLICGILLKMSQKKSGFVWVIKYIFVEFLVGVGKRIIGKLSLWKVWISIFMQFLNFRVWVTWKPFFNRVYCMLFCSIFENNFCMGRSKSGHCLKSGLLNKFYLSITLTCTSIAV